MKIVLLTIVMITVITAVEILIWVLLTAADRRERERLRRIREDYPWDWTKEQERKVEAAMELICDKCKDNDRLNPNETMEECAMCAVRDSLYRLASSRCDR